MGNMINKTYKKLASIFLVFILVFSFLPFLNPTYATINETFNFQAKLTNVNGTNVSDGTYNFRFSIYNASAAGDCLWTAKGTIPGSGACTFAAGSPGTDLVALTVTNGLLNTQLGTTAGSLRSFEDGAASLAQFSNNSLYLDIQIYNGSSWETFGSRKILEAVPYAFRSKYSDNAGTSTNVPLSGLTAASASNTINNANYNQTWKWALTSPDQTGLVLTESTASVSGGTPLILGVNTLASSTAIPIYVQNIGNALSFRVDDQGSDTSPFVVDASGKVGIGTDTPAAFLHIKSGGGVNSGINLEATSAASYGVIDFNTASGLAGQFLATGASFSNGIFTGDQIALASYINTGSTTLVAGGTSGYINFATGGYSASNERMRIIANGNVGIGDTTPASLFTVGNTDLFQIDSSGNIVKLNNVTTSFPGSQGGANTYLKNDGAGNLTWGTALTGVTIPISKLAAASATNTIDNTLYAQTWNWNSLTTETALSLGSSSISSGTLLNLSSTSTAAAGNTQKVLNISTSGANGTSTQTTYGTYVSNTHTGTSSTNIGGYFTASGGATNYPIYIGDSSPPAGSSAGLKIGNMTAASGSAFEAISIGTQSGTGTAGTGISVGTISNSGSSKNYGINLQGITGASTMANYGISIGSVTSSDGVGYGLYIGSVSGSTTNYGIYSSSGNIFFSGNTGIGDNTPASALTVGNGDLFQVNSSGQIAAAAGVTSSGTITFSGLSAMGAIVSTTGGALTSVTSTTGNFLRHNGTTWVASTIQSTDIPTGSGSYIQNQISAVQSSSNFWISDIAGIANGDLNSGGKIRFRKADNSGWDGSIYQTNGNIFTLLAGIGGRIDILDSPGVPNTVYLYNRYDDNALRTSLTLTRSRSSTTAPNANFGSSIDSNLEGFTNNTDLLASRISTFWENNQTNDTTDRDSAISFSTLLDNTFNEKIRISSAGNLGIGDTSPASALTVGSGDLFQVNSSGQIAAAAGITSSGTITFSGLSAMGAIVSTTGGALTSVTSTTGNFLRHNGTTWVASTIASGDIPTGSANYIQNQSGSAQTGNSWISGMTGIANGDLGGGGTIRFRKADNSGWDGAIYEANSNMLYLQSGIGNRITLRDSSSLDLAIFDKTAGSNFYNTTDDNNVYPTLISNRNRSSATAPGAGFGSDVQFILEGFSNTSTPIASAIRTTWENNQTNDTTDRDSTLAFRTMLDNSLSTKLTILSSGNVGIGDTSPVGLLTVGNGDLFQVSTLGNVTLNSINTTQTTTSSIVSLNGNSLTSGTGLYAASSTLSSGKLIDIQVSGTAAASNTQTALNILTAGANGTTTQTTYGAVISNTHTGTLSSNVGASFSASGGTASNTAILASATGTSNNAAIFNSGDVAIRNGITNITNSNDSLNVNKQLGADITGAWTTGATGGTGRDGPTSVLYNGKIYSWGGTNGSNLNTVDIYDIASNSWSTGTAGGTARFYHTSVLYNGKIYSWGGTNGGNLSSVDIYDIAGNSWSTGTAGGTARYGHTSVLYNGKIYSWGGYNGSYLNTVDIYDIAGNSWSTGTAGGTARYIHTSVLYNGKIYSWGGNNGSNLNTVDIYDIASNSWSTGTAGGTARNTHTSVLYYGKIYSWGGTNSIILLNTVDIYDIAGNSWSTGTAGGTARRSPISVLYNGKIYYWGGYTGSYPNTVDIYDIGNRQSILSVQENGQDTFSFQSNSQLFLSSGRLSIMGGNFQIGTTTDSGYKFDVSGSTRFAGNIVNTSGVNATGDQESLVPNTGFEVNDDKTTTVADGWTKFTVSGSGGTASVSTTKIQGEYSQAVVLAANTDGVGFYSPCIPITGGNVYNLYAFARDLTTASNTNALTLRLGTYTSAANCSSRTSPTNYDSVTNGTVTNAFAQYGNTVSPATTQFWGRVEVQFDTPTSADTFYADSVRLTVSSLAAGVDLAENFPIESGFVVDAGDIVSVSSTNSDSGIKYIKKSSGEFDSNVIGIVSTKPGITLDDGNTYTKAKVALAGRVPVKISTLSEAIKAGDYITSSSEEGKAMKASRTGQVIGKALNDWDPLNPTDRIVVLIDNSYYYHRDVEFAAFTDRLNALQNTVNGQNQTLTTTTQLLNTTINSTTTTGPTLSGGFESLDLSKLSGLLSKFSIESDGSLMFNSKAKFSDSLSVDNFVTKKISSENSDILIELNETISKNKLLIANKAGVELFSIDYKGNAKFSRDVTINGDLYVDGKVAGKSVFESKWVEISPNSEESIKHNLGEIPRSINILRATESDCESKNGEMDCTNVTNEGFGNKEMYFYKNLDKSSLKVVNALSDKIFVKVFVTK